MHDTGDLTLDGGARVPPPVHHPLTKIPRARRSQIRRGPSASSCCYRDRMAYRTVDELVALIDEPNGSACARILADHRTLFATVQGSTNNHQA